MAFDLASAKPVEADAPPKKGGFDLGSSKPVAGLPPPTKPPEPPPTFTGALMGGAGDLMKYGPPVGLASMGHRVGSYFDHKRGEFADYAGGKVTDYGAQLGLPPEASAGAGTAVNAGIKMGPDSLAGGAFGKLAAPPVREAARGILQSAMKPTMEQLKTGKAARAVDTMLDQGINVTQGGMDKLHGKITQLDDKIGELIQNSPATIEKTQVARYLHDAYQKFIKEVNPQESLRTIEKAWADFMNHPLLPGEKI